MRGVAVVVGGLLVIGGATVVVLADQQRAAEVAQLHERVEQATERLDDIGDDNLSLAARLTALRSQIAEQDAALTDTAGFMR
jgi:energy-converting hydrogenase A subunit M